MRRLVLPLAAFLFLGLLAAPIGLLAQPVSPRDGGELPPVVRELMAEDPAAFQMQRSWIKKAQRMRELRERALSEGSLKAAQSLKVSGTFEVPVFTATFSDTGGAPYPVADLQANLFGPSPTGYDLTEYYAEISYGAINTPGTVFDWLALPNPEAYYAGLSNGLNPANAKVGEFIKACLDANDAGVDFGIYDNDGPDGVPNSGDDDGFVDFVAFVHPEFGGECGGDNEHIWSHRWVYRAWDASGNVPYQTGDTSANGGVILIDDYVIQPAISCASGGPMIEIGVFCHEFGHAFGLPDLYDTDGGSSGIGHWGLMASGNWNDPDTPAHMGAWSKAELGWVMPISVNWQGASLSIPPAETYSVAYELSFSEDRWRRRTDCALNGSFSLALGLNTDEATARGWQGGVGYGNRWHETVVHEFHSDGDSPVSLSFDWSKDTEAGYDYGLCYFEKDGVETMLAAYDGIGSGNSNFDLTPLLGAAPTSYRIKFRFQSDRGWSDEDGLHDAVCSPMVVDDISLTGGGENYTADFEEHIGGWYQPVDESENPISEKWLVENRQQLGSDLELHGEGLVIQHVDLEVMRSYYGNTGGQGNLMARGVMVEEADDLAQLLSGENRGDDGDVWPGTSFRTIFDSESATNCNSISNSGNATQVAITDIAHSGDDMTANLVGGDPAPSVSGVLPDAHANDVPGAEAVVLDLQGLSETRHGVSVTLVMDGSPDIVADVDWVDRDRVNAVVDLTGAAPGAYDLVLENPDGQTALVSPALQILTAVAAPSGSQLPARSALAQNYPNPFNPSTTIRFQLDRGAPVRLQVIDVRGRVVRTLVNEARDAGWYQVRWNGTDEAGQSVASGLYFYRLRAGEFEDQKKLLLVK